MSRINRQVRLAARPVGEPRPTDQQHVQEPTRSYVRPLEIGNHGKPVLKIAA
ncbi:hypothetical protein [Streptomyces sp. NPDC059010]|uniref:hypothetical protein n=1 Tax=Streptomyces sp. NPDC059010 TaxID=3346695 RepID=UPI0036D066E6